MKFKLDENFGRRTIQLFEQSGFDVLTVHDEKLGGCDDRTIFDICVKERRCLVTLDLDFADVLLFPPHKSSGILVIRLPKNPSLSILENLIKQAMHHLEKNPIGNNLWIVEIGRIRIHQKPDES